MPDHRKAVIYDYSTLLIDDPAHLEQLRATIGDLRERGVKLVSFSTHPRNMDAELRRRNLPQLDLFVTSKDVGAKKGSPVWLTYTAGRLGIATHRLFYVGDDELDWRTAINAGVMFVHAKWAGPKPDKVTAIVVNTPKSAHKFITHFFLPAPRWGYRVESPGDRVHVRCLLNATYQLVCDQPSYFSLQTIFTYEQRRAVGGQNARDLLMLHAISNLYAEGLIDSGTRFAVYPSSTPGQTNETFTEFLDPAAKFFHGWLKEGMLVRAAQAPDTSLLRHARRHGEVTFLNQATTVHVDESLRTHFAGKNVVVFDDFTTSGMSLEWARNLLYAAGAERVVLVTFGKYRRSSGASHTRYDPVGITVSPFGLRNYQQRHFAPTEMAMVEDDPSMRITQEMFRAWKDRKPFVQS
jgi:hypothetical protein